MKDPNFRGSQIIYQGFQSLSGFVGILGTLMSLGVISMPSIDYIPTRLAEAINSDVKPVTSHRGVPIASSGDEEGEIKQILLIRDSAKSMDWPADDSIVIRQVTNPQWSCPESENSKLQMKEWGNIDCLEADQLRLVLLPDLSIPHQKEFFLWPVTTMAAGREKKSCSPEALPMIISNKLLFAPKWKVERFRIATVLSTLISLATLALTCLVAKEAYQYLRKRDTLTGTPEKPVVGRPKEIGKPGCANDVEDHLL